MCLTGKEGSSQMIIFYRQGGVICTILGKKNYSYPSPPPPPFHQNFQFPAYSDDFSETHHQKYRKHLNFRC